MAKRARKKILAAILSLLLMICFMPVAIHAEPTTETADFVTDTGSAIELLGGAGYVEYDMDKNEITLKGVDFSTSAPVAVRLPDDVKLVLQSGTVNRIISIYNGDDFSTSSGIEIGNFTIYGNGTLEVIGGTGCDSCYGIDAASITISGGEVTATGGEALRSSSGISASSITISGGQVTGRGGKARWDSWGINAGSISISGTASVIAIGGDAEDSLGISASSALTISGG